MSEYGCEFVGKSDGDRGRCKVTAGFFDPQSNGMGLLCYCVDCGANLCEHHLAKHFCRAMRTASAKRGEAVARYETDAEA